MSAESLPIRLFNLLLILLIVLTFAIRLFLLFRLNIHWDEFFFLSRIYELERGALSGVVQTFHAYALIWIPWLSSDGITQILIGRGLMFLLSIASAIYTYLIARYFFSSSAALFSVFCYVSFSNMLEHGASFRYDPLLAFVFLFCFHQALTKPLSLYHLAILGACMGGALMWSIKAAMHLLTLLILLWMCIRNNGWRRRISVYISFLLPCVLLFFLWFLLQRSSVPQEATERLPSFFKNLGQDAFRIDYLFDGRSFVVQSFVSNVFICAYLLVGILLSLKALFCSDADSVIAPRYLSALGVSLLYLFVFRNAFPYFLVFVLSPPIVFTGVLVDKLIKDWTKSSKPFFLVFSVLLVLPVLMTFLFHVIPLIPNKTLAQRQILRVVNKTFPQPVSYLDRCSMIAQFPKVGPFMSSWTRMRYQRDGKSVVADLFDTKAPVFVLLNHPGLEETFFPSDSNELPRDRFFSSVDEQLLRENYIHHWGPIFVAGKKIFLDEAEQDNEFKIEVPGVYTLEASGNVLIDGTMLSPGESVLMERGLHQISSKTAKAESVVLRWGDTLYRSEEAPLDAPLFDSF